MIRTSLDDAQWMSLMLVVQQIPHAWKRDEMALCRFVEAALWICRTGAPWRDLPETLGLWSSVYRRWRRWCLCGWRELVFKPLRPSLPADGLLLLDSTTCKAHRAASGAVGSAPQAKVLGRSRGGHHVENLFSSLKDWARIAFGCDKTHCSWMGFAHLAATRINIRVAESSQRP